MKRYFAKELETKWQKKWEESGIYQAEDHSGKPKKYILDMFPYPSGEGLHVGHFKGYVATDILSRYYRAKGFNVLHPMGWDAFGLPAENYAIKMGIHPSVITEKNITNIRRQMQIAGLSYDWSREINTTDPEYYKWTQWIFLKLFEKGLAYEAQMPINFCPSCKTGLANEEVVGGRCERCGTEVIRKPLRQWVLRITKYADRLIEGLESLDWPQFIKEMQVNWIGRSEGAEVIFDIADIGDRLSEEKKKTINVFTTRVDTIFGVTALILAPEHSKVLELTTAEHRAEVEKYLEEVKSKSDLERTAVGKVKTGVFTGAYAVNPMSGSKIPIWVADYVLGFYGTGAVMFVPAHDTRDAEFAKKFNLEIIPVVDEESGRLINSGEFEGLPAESAKKEFPEILKREKHGDFKIEYKLRDWGFSRQRYWGEPIPLIHCDPPAGGCGVVPVPEGELPVRLPEVEKYLPTGTGESPLAAVESWVNTRCPKCGGPGKRETNTMPQWAGSCWYFLRFIDPKNNQELVSKQLEEYWMGGSRLAPHSSKSEGGVDWYVGGAEHAVLHLLYSRFWHKFLFDIGAVSTEEPFQKLTSVGLVLAADGRKMSKSLGNVIKPDQIVEEYGADTLRVYESFMGPFENTIAWDPTSINGAYKFLNRIWEVIQKEETGETDNKVEQALHRLFLKVEGDIQNMKFNTSVAAMMEFVNLVFHQKLTREQKKRFLIILAPFAPYMAEELWQMVNGRWYIVDGEEKGTAINHKQQVIRQLAESEPPTDWSVHQQPWPEADPKHLEEGEATVAIQVNGKTRDQIVIQKDMASHKEVVEKMVVERPRVAKFLAGKQIKKVIYVPVKIINLVTE